VAPDLTRPSEWLKLVAAFFRHDKTREAIGVLAMAAAILAFVSLATFDPRDPSFFNYASEGATERQIYNAVGRVGAEAAGDLLGILGLSALLVPPVFFVWGWTWVGGRRLAHPVRRAAGLALLASSLSLLASVLHQVGFLPGGRVERPGGFLGDELFRWLLFSLGKFGLGVLALAGLVLAIICLSQRPLLSFLALPASGFTGIWTRAQAALIAWRARRARPAPAAVPTPAPPVTEVTGAGAGRNGSRPGGGTGARN